MKSKDLKRLSRSDLLEMMLALSKENEQLRESVMKLQKDAENRIIAVERAGSLAEAALQLSGVFAAAQAACDAYTENVRYRYANQDEICRRREAETRDKCDEMTRAAQEACERMQQEMRAKCAAMEQEMRSKCDRILAETRKNARELLLEAKKKSLGGEDYSWLMDILEKDKSKDDTQ